MYKVLINAYAVSPSWGSEQGMGWNWLINLAKYCDVYVITEGEWKTEIEAELQEAKIKGLNSAGTLSSEQANRLHFYYNPVPEKVRQMCWNQGDWRFYYYYKKWQDSTLKLAHEIMKDVDIDVVHQLNMIGYREPGMLWKIDDKPYVWGPVGGLELMPESYLKGESVKLKFVTYAKNLLNRIQRSHMLRFQKALRRADAVVCATKGVYEYISSNYKPEAVLINETGCFIHNQIEEYGKKGDKRTLDIMWVGKFDFRKQLAIALHTMALLKDVPEIKLHVYGTGDDSEVLKYTQMIKDLGISQSVILYGRRPNKEIHDAMRQHDLFLFTSIMDATSTVVLEAISCGMPIICLDTCGYGPIVDEKIGEKVAVSNAEQNAREYAEIIRKLNGNREKINEMSIACIEKRNSISWDANVRKMLRQYDFAVERFNENKKE